MERILFMSTSSMNLSHTPLKLETTLRFFSCYKKDFQLQFVSRDILSMRKVIVETRALDSVGMRKRL